MSASKSRSKASARASSASGGTEGADPSFEQELEELERIVDELEHGSLALEESLSRFERGMKLSKQLETRLRAAEARVRKWTPGAEEVPEHDASERPQTGESGDGGGRLF